MPTLVSSKNPELASSDDTIIQTGVGVLKLKL